MDEVDLQIISALQQNARTSNADLARLVGIAPSAMLERVRKLEERGFIRGYAANINARAVGFGLTAFVFVRSDDMSDETAGLLADVPEVQEVHNVAGEDCYLLKVRVADTESLGKLLTERISKIKTIRSTRSIIVLQTIKETSALPLEVGKRVKG